jgi:DNA polymerase-3 subunit delta
MKVYPEKLAARIKQGVGPVYIVSGDEPLLVQENCDLIRGGLRQAGYSEREVCHVAPSFDWQEVLFSANSMSLFAEQRLLEVRCTAKPDKVAIEALKTYVANVPADTSLLLVLPKIDKKVEATAWFKSLDAVGVHVAVWPVGVDDLPRWIEARFQAAGLRASKDAVRAMVDRIEGNLLAAVQEIQRLRLIVDGDVIDLEHVLDGVGDSSRYNVFNLIDAAVGQDPKRTLKVIEGLRVEGIAMPLVAILLSRELRTLISIAGAVEKGQKVDAAIQKVYVFPNRRSLVARCVSAQGRRRLEAVQRQVGRLDKLSKGIGKGNVWDLLTSLMLALAGQPVIKRQPA